MLNDSVRIKYTDNVCIKFNGWKSGFIPHLHFNFPGCKSICVKK